MIDGEGDKSFIDPTLLGKLPAAFAASSGGLFRKFVSNPFDGIPPISSGICRHQGLLECQARFKHRSNAKAAGRRVQE